jgi:hypothetical protein
MKEELGMIRKRNRTSLVLVVMAVLLAGVTVSAWAHGRGRRGGPGDGPFGGGRGAQASGLVQRLIFPCQGACFDAARTCHQTTDTAAVTCAEQSCGSDITAARTACASDTGSTACREARAALVSCMQPCLDTERTAFRACRTTAGQCLDACDSPTGQ